MGFLGLGNDKELEEHRAQLQSRGRPKESPIEATKSRLEKLAAETYRDYKPQPFGLKLWWVLGYKGDKEHFDGPHYSFGDADRRLSVHFEGQGKVFELRNIDTKREAREAILKILKDEREEEQKYLRGRLQPEP